MKQPIFVDTGPQWLQAEEELNRAGLPMPLFHRWAWAKYNRKSRHRLLTLRTASGQVFACAAVQMDNSRVLPWHYYLRMIRFGHGLPQAAWEPMIAALSNLAQSDARVLRLSVGVFSREHRSESAALLAQHGFQRAAQPRSYRHTLTMDMQPDESEILNGMHKTARKNLRDAEKSTLCVRTLTDVMYAERIGSLQEESMSRTGGKHEKQDWRSILELSRVHPNLSRVVGLFSSDLELQPDALVGFGWGCMHGDHGEYHAAGTTRLPDLKLSLSYPLLWNLILWSRQQGASWFDLGGVTLGDSATDPLGGISDFKRYFSRVVEEVGDEWTLEPHPARIHLAELLGKAARGSADILRRLRRGKQTNHDK